MTVEVRGLCDGSIPKERLAEYVDCISLLAPSFYSLSSQFQGCPPQTHQTEPSQLLLRTRQNQVHSFIGEPELRVYSD